MLVVGINNRRPPEATESTVFGPFFVEGSPALRQRRRHRRGASGRAVLHAAAACSSVDGEPVAGARVEVWQADEDGFYDVQYADLDEPRGRGHLFTGEDGRFWFWSVKPEAYPIPADGPVGELLAAGGRGPMRPAHVHFMVTAEGFQTLITHVFVEGDEYLDSDAVFGVRSRLIGAVRAPRAGRGTGREEAGRALLDDELRPRSLAPHDRDRRPDRRLRPGRQLERAVPEHLRRREHRHHEVPLDGEHAARAHHQPARRGDHARHGPRGRDQGQGRAATT